MKKVTGKTFTNEKVELDATHFEDCAFKSCTFVYLGLTGISMKDTKISPDCRFMFSGFAANTVLAMRGIYEISEWGRDTILSTFREIAPADE